MNNEIVKKELGEYANKLEGFFRRLNSFSAQDAMSPIMQNKNSVKLNFFGSDAILNVIVWQKKCLVLEYSSDEGFGVSQLPSGLDTWVSGHDVVFEELQEAKIYMTHLIWESLARTGRGRKMSNILLLEIKSLLISSTVNAVDVKADPTLSVTLR